MNEPLFVPDPCPRGHKGYGWFDITCLACEAEDDPARAAELDGIGISRERVHYNCQRCGEWGDVWTWTPDLVRADLTATHESCVEDQP